jgi:RNA polymerase sigma-70 factor (ECF subfamily)
LGLDRNEAEDVASETFLAAYQNLGKFRGGSSLSTWLWKIAYYKGINYLRKNKKHSHGYMEIDEQLADRKLAHMAARLEDAEQNSAIWDAVNALPGQWAMAIILFYREDKSVEEIAKIMRKRYNTVKTYLFRGRKKLKSVLGDII